MSGTEPQGKRREERERAKHKSTPGSGRKKPAARQRWIAHPTDSGYLVPSGKAEKYPEEIGNLGIVSTVGGVIHSDTLILHAVTVDVNEIELSEHTPRRSDYAYLHPDTMRQCGVGIAQCVAVINADKKVATVCKAWPVPRIALDAVAVSRTTRQSCQAGPVSLLELRSLGRPSALPTAEEIHLRPMSPVTFPLNTSFKSYLLHTHNGCFVTVGNIVSVQFYGEERDFEVVMVMPADAGGSLDVSLSDSTREDALSLDLSRLSLEATPTRVSSNQTTPTRGHSNKWGPAGTPVQVMEESELCASEDGVDPEDKNLGTEQKLDLKQAERGWDASELAICRVTPRTKVSFIEERVQETVKAKWPCFSDVGGLDYQVQLLKELVMYPLEHPEAVQAQGLQLSHGILLYGPSGVGKSLLVRALANEIAVHTMHVTATDVLLSMQDSESKLKEVFTICRENSPALLVIDDLHTLAPHKDHTPSETERRATATLASLMDQLHTASGHVVVVAATNQIEGVELSLRRPGRFGKQVDIPVPSAGARREILDMLLRGIPHSLTGQDIVQVADAAHGHVGADLHAVCMEGFLCRSPLSNLRIESLEMRLCSALVHTKRTQDYSLWSRFTSAHVPWFAQHKALQRWLEGGGGGGEGVRVGWEDVRVALREVRPSAMREVTLEVPKVLWSEVGGQEDIKQKLRESVEWPLTHPEAFSRLGIVPPRGVLMYGPPGCSKTMIARALATESGLNFIAVKGPELFSKWVGDSERAVRQVFSRGRTAAPAIIFFDEIDALAVSRKGGSSSVADRVLAQLLTEMDGLETLREVLVVAATNRPDLIDKALLRPGRFDRIIYVPLPSLDTRREILKLQFRKTPVGGDVDLEWLVEQTKGFSGAEVVSLCQEAALCAMHESISAVSVSRSHFQEALSVVKPQTDATTVQFYENYHSTVGTKGN